MVHQVSVKATVGVTRRLWVVTVLSQLYAKEGQLIPYIRG